MAEKLIPLTIPPGLYKNGTRYQAKGRWYDADLVRFIEGTIQPIGGWRRAQNDSATDLAQLTGLPRAAVGWALDSGDAAFAVATTQKLYVIAGGVLNDITPAALAAGQADTLPATDYGSYGGGAYGAGPYGAGSLATRYTHADTWQLDVFEGVLAGITTADEKLYIWDGIVADVAAQAVGSPTGRGVVITPERFIFVLGAEGVARRVRWASQFSSTDWIESEVNTAGAFDLTSEGRLMCGRRTKTQTLLWTDADVHVATYIGGILVYRFDPVGEKCGIIAPNAAVTLDTTAFWMGRDNFFVYDGYTKPLPCDVWDHVFNDLNTSQLSKIWATTCAQYGEVTWHYPSGGSMECDRYVTYNYRENHWTVGELARACGFDAGSSQFPVKVSPDGYVYEHEVGLDMQGAVPFLESGPIELGSGDNVMRVQRLVPDEKNLGDVQATIFSSFYPTETETANGPYAVGAPTDVRFTARQCRLQLDEVNRTSWRIGTFRLGVSPGGRR